MRNFFMLYIAPYGLTVLALGEHSSIEGAESRAQKESPMPMYILDESELRAFKASIQNVLTKS